ncbi:universal stress protein [Chloroflexota bacterium]
MPNSTNGTADIKKHGTVGKFTKGSQQPGRHPLDILLADDGSKHAQAAVDMLCDLPLPPETTIHALVVVPTLDRPRHILLETALSETETQLKKSGVQVHTEIKGGVPAASINDYAERHKPDLVVLGAKGLRATLGILLGGVAQQVVEYSCCPVMVVRAPYLGTRRVLAVTDGSVYSQCALAYLGADIKETADMRTNCEARLPLPEEVDIRIMHILPPLITSDMLARSWTVGPDVLFPIPAEPIDEKALQEEEERQGQALLDEAVRAMKSGGVESSNVLMRGDAATEIINYVKENDIDLIVCGSRGLSQVSGWLLGSVSRKLVHYAECSVLIVKRGRHEENRK